MSGKREFIEKLGAFCIESDACQRINLHHLDYVKFRGDEWLYIFVGTYGFNEKRVNITGDSNESIVRDFFNALQNWGAPEMDYLTPGYMFKDLGGETNE